MIVAVVVTLFGAFVVWTPARAAAPLSGRRCDEIYDIASSSVPHDQLPGIGEATEWAGDPLTYQYANPGEAARDLPELTGKKLRDYGSNPNGKQPGTPEHLYATWNKYLARKAQEGKPPLPWKRWLNLYVPNMGNARRGAAFEQLVAETLGLSGPDWLCQVKVGDRIFDAVNEKLGIAYEFKSNNKVIKTQVIKDAQLAKQLGLRNSVQYINGDKPTAGTQRTLRGLGLRDSYFLQATPEETNQTTTPGPADDLYTPDLGEPSAGPLGDMVDESGKDPAEAGAIEDANEELGDESGFPDQIPEEPGGIDFSTLELRYVTDDPSRNGFQFALQANPNSDENNPSYGGLADAQLSSDALFTWLALPPSDFWVNLNPDHPDKTIQSQLASTDAGRVMLQSDLTLKHTAAKLQVPDNPTGDTFWSELRTANGLPCWYGYRVWIAPAPATVRDSGGQLYILDAPLTVKTARLDIKKLPPGYHECDQPQAIQDYNFSAYNRVIVPKLAEEVNTSADFADLRRVYFSRIAAEWIIQRNKANPNAYAKIIGSDTVKRWPARMAWSRQTVYDAYLDSYLHGDYHFIRTYPYNGVPYIYPVMTGGVDFSKAPRVQIAPATFKAHYPALPATVKNSQLAPLSYRKTDATLLGDAFGHPSPPPPTRSPSPAPTHRASPPSPHSTGPALAATGTPPVRALAISGLVLIAAGTTLLLRQRSRRKSVG